MPCNPYPPAPNNHPNHRFLYTSPPPTFCASRPLRWEGQASNPQVFGHPRMLSQRHPLNWTCAAWIMRVLAYPTILLCRLNSQPSQASTLHTGLFNL